MLLELSSAVDELRVPGCDLQKGKPRVSMEIHRVQTKELEV